MTEIQSGLRRDPLSSGERTPESELARVRYIYSNLRETVIRLFIEEECPDRYLRDYANSLRVIDDILAKIDSKGDPL